MYFLYFKSIKKELWKVEDQRLKTQLKLTHSKERYCSERNGKNILSSMNEPEVKVVFMEAKEIMVCEKIQRSRLAHAN